MKTYTQFIQDLYEFRKTLDTANQFMKTNKPITKGLTGLSRAGYVQQAVQGKTALDKVAGVAGVIQPMGILPFAAPTIFRQGKTGSSTDSITKGLHNVTKKITKGRIQTNPETDIGKRTGDFITKKIKQIPSNLKKARENMDITTM